VKQYTPTDISVLGWLTVDINSVSGSLHYVAVGSVAVISGVHASLAFRAEIYRFVDFLWIYELR
jgi:hypothetical protein